MQNFKIDNVLQMFLTFQSILKNSFININKILKSLAIFIKILNSI